MNLAKVNLRVQNAHLKEALSGTARMSYRDLQIQKGIDENKLRAKAMKHTEGKWTVQQTGIGWRIQQFGKIICWERTDENYRRLPEAEANAEYICLAVNNHEALVTALQNCRDAFRDAGLNIHADGCEVTLNNLNSKP